MKTEKIVWGLILIFTGGILLLENFDVIDFYWGSIWRFWPLVLILIGANMLLSKSNSRVNAVAGITITIAVLAFVAYVGISGRNRPKQWFNYEYNIDGDADDVSSGSGKWKNNAFSEPYTSATKRARLDISGGATEYSISDTTSNLIEADVKHRNSGYSLKRVSADSVETLKFSMRSGKNRFSFNDIDETKAKLRLNPNPLWDINVSMGAGEVNFDLAAFKVSSLKFKGGAASFQAKLGVPEDVTHVTTETGMTEIKLSVPRQVGCQIKVNSGISSRSFEGFSKQSDGTYTTSNFDPANKRIIISLKGGLSDFEVSRY